jgi:hypothetical protein
MTLYLKDPKDSIRKFLGLISTFSKVAGTKPTHEKQVAFLYSNDKHAEKEIRKAITFIVTSKYLE